MHGSSNTSFCYYFQATLYSLRFSYNLKLGHHAEAYQDMIANPDVTRRKDCLRQFLITLFERRELKALIDFPYNEMYEDVEKIIEARARSLDLMTNNYYDFLYSFHVMKGNMRKGIVLNSYKFPSPARYFQVNGICRGAQGDNHGCHTRILL